MCFLFGKGYRVCPLRCWSVKRQWIKEQVSQKKRLWLTRTTTVYQKKQRFKGQHPGVFSIFSPFSRPQPEISKNPPNPGLTWAGLISIPPRFLPFTTWRYGGQSTNQGPPFDVDVTPLPRNTLPEDSPSQKENRIKGNQWFSLALSKGRAKTCGPLKRPGDPKTDSMNHAGCLMTGSWDSKNPHVTG